MHTAIFRGVVLALSASVSASAILPRANRKANEFSSGDCRQGTASYEHESNYNIDVTMDDTSHSVYFASGPWYFYSEKASDGGLCGGELIGSWQNKESEPCVNLDARGEDYRRIKCVEWNNDYHKHQGD
ncbi:Small secreted protein [Teratosphaeria destructans]|uniref:Small secreted protein n=1 Tax=Teratosphaeria destructans TaxID=418781 RepID=A0A9W7SKD0_9PEZI|nr:Small secreted protein [Teratosphaeria destructans]